MRLDELKWLDHNRYWRLAYVHLPAYTVLVQVATPANEEIANHYWIRLLPTGMEQPLRRAPINWRCQRADALTAQAVLYELLGGNADAA